MKYLTFLVLFLYSFASFSCEVVINIPETWACSKLQAYQPPSTILFDINDGDTINVEDKIVFITNGCTNDTYFKILDLDHQLLQEVEITGPNTFFAWGSDCTALPVELAQQSVKRDRHYVMVQFLLTGSYNTDHAMILSSGDGFSWSEQQMVPITTTINAKKYLSAVRSNHKYWRIMFVDTDGSFEYSDIMTVEERNGFSVDITQNGAVLNSDQREIVKVYTTNGKFIKEYNLSPNEPLVINDKNVIISDGEVGYYILTN